MRRFFIGLLVGIIAGFVVAWWRLGRRAGMGPAQVEREPMRIALPDVPVGDGDEDEIPTVKPVGAEAGGSVQDVADVLARAREAVAGPEPLMAYCARCRAKRAIQNPEPTASKDGRPAVRGTCPECGANMFRFVSY